jgi:hypothetical protein
MSVSSDRNWSSGSSSSTASASGSGSDSGTNTAGNAGTSSSSNSGSTTLKRSYLEYVSGKNYTKYQQHSRDQGWASAGAGKPYVPLGTPVLDLVIEPTVRLHSNRLHHTIRTTSAYKAKSKAVVNTRTVIPPVSAELKQSLNLYGSGDDYDCIRQQLEISDHRRLRAKAGAFPGAEVDLSLLARKKRKGNRTARFNTADKTSQESDDSKTGTGTNALSSAIAGKATTGKTEEPEKEYDPISHLASHYVEFGITKLELGRALAAEMEQRPSTFRDRLRDTFRTPRESHSKRSSVSEAE